MVSIHFVSCILPFDLLGYADEPLLFCVIFVDVIQAVGHSAGAVWEPSEEPSTTCYGFRLDRWPERLAAFKEATLGVVFVEIVVTSFRVILVLANSANLDSG